MKKIIYPILFSLLFLFSLNQTKAQCLLAKAYPYANFWDSCSNNKGSLNAYVAFKAKSSCFKYEWTVNGNLVDSSYLLHYTITQNGTYDVCVKVKDTCNNCDTTICSKRTITCFSSTCNWASRYGKVNNFDSCSNNAASMNAYIYFNYGSSSCFKYEWTVNGSKVSSGTNYPYYIKYQITQNGTYDLCVKVSDTCNNCDTTFCSKRTFTCFSSSSCNWKARYTNTYFWDSCNSTTQSLNAYVSFQNYSTSCFKYQWSVNGTLVDTTHNILNYKISKNGTYDVCIKVIDTCNNCDTTICSKRTITCFKSTCNWAARNIYTTFFDSCTAKAQSLNGYIVFKNYSTNCFKYEWTVDGNVVGTNYIMNSKVTKNGTYNVCIKVTDTCNNCDTTICSKRTISCFSSGSTCNWSARPYNYYVGDSCYKSTSSTISAYIAFKTKGCYTYQWTVGGNNAGTGLSMQYSVSKNATYSICVKVTDTCNNCDTTICWSKTVTCIASNCNWASRYPNKIFTDSCKNGKANLFGYISFNSNLYKCFKYQWTVNGNNVGTGSYINYAVSQNGTYNLCVKVTDTCNNCDTTFCSSRVVNCYSTTCNWASRYPNTSFWDSCKNNKASLNGYVSFNTKGCFKYQWTVNGNNVGTGSYYINYPVYNNGTYSLCCKVMDTCNNCDTTFCSSRVITCYGSSSTCNWASRYPNKYLSDSCKGSSASIFGYVSFNSNLAKCFKYQWTVNGNAVSTTATYISYNVTQNGTYNICVKVTDTCNNCDTTICSSRTITCIKNSSTCNWASRYPNSIFRDSCKNTSVNLFGYISFNSNLYKCFKYQWTVNGNAVGSGQYTSYTVTQNGTYNVCVKVTDTCNNCDTTICSTRTVTCLGGCNWASKTPYTYLWDSCKSNLSFVNAYISFKTKGCYKYQWTVNGNNAGNGYVMKYAIFNAGTYNICVKVTDTCNNCDTIICVKYKTNCYNGINNIELSEGINLYPNPTQGIVKLDWNKGNSSYVIYNISGQSIATGYLTNGVQTLDLSAYPTGLYILQIKAADANITKKIFLQKE